MGKFIRRKTRQSAALLGGILLTLLAVIAHRFLPERRLTLDAGQPDATYFLMQSGDGAPVRSAWLDQARMHFTCDFPAGGTNQSCSFTYLLYAADAADQGIDLSRFRKLNLAIRYSGNAHYLRIAVRDFDPRFSHLGDSNSSKFNYVNLHPKDVLEPLAIGINEFAVPEWWVTQYDLPRDQIQPDLSNATAFSLDLLGDLAGTHHDVQIDRIEFTGDWISAESWYLGILCVWMLLGTAYGVTTWLRMRRRAREQQRRIRDLQIEKDKFERLSTLDALTRILNRHGIERFVDSLRRAHTAAGVIIIDLDHFKWVNDERGHFVGDRVLQTVGDVLRAHSRATDGLGRWGGEEFVLVCPGASLATAADMAEKLRLRIMETQFIPEEPLRLTASLGVAVANADQTYEDAFRQADQALYLAKNRGRNCVVAATEDQMHRVTGARKSTWAQISGRFKLHR